LLRDLDSPLILAYDVFAQVNDNGVVQPMVEQFTDQIGHKPEVILVDSGYVSGQHLQFCDLAKITIYGPSQENDFSRQNGKKKQHNQYTELPKSAFQWLKDKRTYQCPEGHLLQFQRTQQQRRVDYTIELSLYTCPKEHCLACPRQAACTRTPRKGRTVSRMEHEDLLDELRDRMTTDEAKQLYKLRSRTVELSYADMKEHRGLRRFHGRGLSRAKTELGTMVLAHNLRHVDKYFRARRDGPAITESHQISSTA
jgi:hypothetical protein